MTSRTRTINALQSCYQSIEELIATLSPEDWATPSLCPAWNVQGVVGHLTGIEHILTGWEPQGTDNPPPFAAIADFDSEAKTWSPDRLVEETGRVFAARRQDLANTDDAMFATESMTPVGPGTYHRFMDIRVFDFWVHERDMTTPLGRATDDGGPAAEIALDEVHNSIGYIVGKKIGLPDGMSLAIRLTGPIERDIFAAVDGRAAKVDHIADPTVELTTDSVTFVQLACGRIDPSEVISADRIGWSGNAEWGEKAARNLRFTM